MQASKEVDRKSERLKYVFTAPGLVMIALLLGFLSIFVGVSVPTARRPVSVWGLTRCVTVRCAFFSRHKKQQTIIRPRLVLSLVS